MRVRLRTRRCIKRVYSLRKSSSPPGQPTRSRTRWPVYHTIPTSVNVTVLLRNPRLVICNHNRYRHHPTHPIKGPDVHCEYSPTVDSTIVDPHIRVRVRRTSSRIHRFHHLTQTVGGSWNPIQDTQHHPLLDSTRPNTSLESYHCHPWSTPPVPVPLGRWGPSYESTPRHRRRDYRTATSPSPTRDTGVGTDHPHLVCREIVRSVPSLVRDRNHRHRTWIELVVGIDVFGTEWVLIQGRRWTRNGQQSRNERRVVTVDNGYRESIKSGSTPLLESNVMSRSSFSWLKKIRSQWRYYPGFYRISDGSQPILFSRNRTGESRVFHTSYVTLELETSSR